MLTPGRRRATIRSIASVALATGILAAYAFPLAAPAYADWPETAHALDVEPETDSGPAGTTFTLTATVYDDDGQIFSGPGTDTEVRFYFRRGSPNDPHRRGADMTCRTGTDGTCSVSYQGDDVGTDSICGVVTTSAWWRTCREPVDAPERDNLSRPRPADGDRGS